MMVFKMCCSQFFPLFDWHLEIAEAEVCLLIAMLEEAKELEEREGKERKAENVRAQCPT